ncbi:MAG: glutamate-1-semialdehyde 2,1-aminomutase [Candidatus Acidiferrales bacterium]|jgi:glutamate-1-semialdehyde 2,1-aminomutase
MPSKSRPRSAEIFQRSEKILVGGVDSPVRAFRAVGGSPLIIERADGARLYDVDGNEYLDYVCSWGAMILGHAHPSVTKAIQEQAACGTSYGMTSPLESQLAEQIASAMPSIEMMRFVSSGTEATMSAIRLARGFTKRDLIVKFEGCYHGHSDSFLSQAGSGLATLGISASPGVPEAFAKLTINVPYNDLAAVERVFDAHKGGIAAVIVEPVAANMGVVPPAEGFLEGLREVTRRGGALLILDEVISGFRMALGGAQSVYKIRPDLTTLGKIIGGGLPVAAYGGRREIMQMVAPLGPVYQAGTLSGNPLAMRAGLATLPHLRAPGFYDALDRKAARLAEGISGAIRDVGVAAHVNAVGSLVTLFFCDGPVRNYGDAKRSDTKRFAAYFTAMLERGIFLAPSQYEALFVSAAHTDADIERTISASRESLGTLLAAAPAD